MPKLTRHGHRAGTDTVADLLREEGFSLQGNVEKLESADRRNNGGSRGKQHCTPNGVAIWPGDECSRAVLRGDLIPVACS